MWPSLGDMQHKMLAVLAFIRRLIVGPAAARTARHRPTFSTHITQGILLLHTSYSRQNSDQKGSMRYQWPFRSYHVPADYIDLLGLIIPQGRYSPRLTPFPLGTLNSQYNRQAKPMLAAMYTQSRPKFLQRSE